jgi:5-dehydro-2-deoxygluconokinase
MQLEAMADEAGADRKLIGRFKQLCQQVVEQVAAGKKGYGLLCDSRLGRDALYRAAGKQLWIGRPVEWPGSRPLSLEPELGDDLGTLREWPLEHIVKVLCFYHSDDDESTRLQQEQTLKRLFTATRRNRLEFLLEIIPSKAGPVDDDTTARVIERIYQVGIYPDWWKLEPMQSGNAWQKTCDTINRYDPYIQGIVVLGLGATSDDLEASFVTAAKQPLVKGFAVGRTIFNEPAKAWFAGEIDDPAAIRLMSENYKRLCDSWDRARGLEEETS